MTRAKSLVIAVGNPFLLLSMEKQMIKRYGKKGNCWSTFLKRCTEKGTLEFTHTIPVEKQREYVDQLCQSIQEVNPDPQVFKEDVALKRIAELEASLNQLFRSNPSVAAPQPSYSSNEASPIHVGGFPLLVQQQSPVSLSESQNSPTAHNSLFRPLPTAQGMFSSFFITEIGVFISTLW